MAVGFGRGNHQSGGRSCTSNKVRLGNNRSRKVLKQASTRHYSIKVFIVFPLKLEQIKHHHYSLSLDPPSNHHHHQDHHHHQPQQSLFQTSKHVIQRVGEEEQEQEQESLELPFLAQHHQYFHHTQPPPQNQNQHYFHHQQQLQLPPEPTKKRSYHHSSSSPPPPLPFQEQNKEHAGKMAERQQTSSKLAIRNTSGEIVEVQGDRIVRSTGRKDRHSKVCTAKGPRDRRVRLSAHTAIQFYDVQDRLGYDRPSKAVDWLIKKAKASIDELAELPPWTPATVAAAKSKPTKDQLVMQTGGSIHEQQQQQLVENSNNENNASFLPPSLDSDAIADTIKSFFPTGASVETSSAAPIQFQNYPPDLLSRTSSQNQDLRLSLQSFQEPILLQHHHHGHSGDGAGHSHNQQVLFSGTGGHNHHHLGFDGASAGWSEQHQGDINRYQRMAAWNAAGDGMFHPSAASSASLMQPFFGQNQFFSQRGPLQSSNTPSVRAWIDPAMAADHNQMPHIHQQSFISSLGFTPSSTGGFSGFRVPARIQGEEEEHDGTHNKPSSASSDSRR